LGSICHVDLDDGDLPALLHASRSMRDARGLCDFLQLVGSARKKDQI